MEIIKDLGIHITKAGYRKRYVLAKCKCGKEFKVIKNAIVTGNTKSCGCGINRVKPNTSYKAYWVLQDMKKRCYAKYSDYYHLYGGRGVSVCQEWLNDAKLFIDWCNDNGYKKGLYIDRINPNGNYNPLNCRFVDARLNATNTRLLGINNNSGFRGVSKHITRAKKIKWRSRITYNKKIISLGVFDKKEDAAIAYDNYVIKNKLEHPINFKKKTNLYEI